MLPAWLAESWTAASDPVATATDSLISQGTGWTVAVIMSGVLVYMWRRDVRRSDEALTYERARTAEATVRANRAETALAEQNREIRSEVVPALTRTTEIAAEYVQQLRSEPRRRSG